MTHVTQVHSSTTYPGPAEKNWGRIRSFFTGGRAMSTDKIKKSKTRSLELSTSFTFYSCNKK